MCARIKRPDLCLFVLKVASLLLDTKLGLRMAFSQGSLHLIAREIRHCRRNQRRKWTNTPLDRPIGSNALLFVLEVEASDATQVSAMEGSNASRGTTRRPTSLRSRGASASRKLTRLAPNSSVVQFKSELPNHPTALERLPDFNRLFITLLAGQLVLLVIKRSSNRLS